MGLERPALLTPLLSASASYPTRSRDFLAQGKHAFNMGGRSKVVSVKTWPQRMADWLLTAGISRRLALSSADDSAP